MAGEQILVVEDNEKNMKLLPGRPPGEGVPHPRGDDRRAGDRACDRARARARAHGHPAAGHRRRRGARDGCGRTTRTASIPVLALTAQAMQGDRERFLAAGFDGYVSKPVDVVELVATVQRHCDGADR